MIHLIIINNSNLLITYHTRTEGVFLTTISENIKCH